MIVFQPGMSGFPDRIGSAFAEGLVEGGWSVELRTIGSPGDDANLSSFDLVVLLTPVYWWSPSPPMARYLRRVRGALAGRKTIPLLTASGQGDRAMRQFVAAVEAAGGKVAEPRVFYRWRPNDENDLQPPNEDVAVNIARKRARDIHP